MDQIINIENKIEQLKKKKQRIQTQQAILFRQEAEKIFQDGFSSDLALAVLADWKTATDAKKKEWTARSHSFRPVNVQNAEPKAKTHNSTDQQN